MNDQKLFLSKIDIIFTGLTRDHKLLIELYNETFNAFSLH